MNLVPLKIPPGVVKAATEYEAKGRWVESSLVRWHDGVMQPIGGWSVLPGAGSVGGPVRGALAYRRVNGQARLIFGTPSRLYDYHDGSLVNITPPGFAAGQVQASGNFYARNEAATWQIAMFGEDPIACAVSDGKLYQFNSSIGGAVTQLTDSPEGCVGVTVTPEGFVVALGAGGDRRTLAWADQRSLSAWSPATDNQAGDFPLQTGGNLLAARPGRQETLVWTDTDLWSMRYLGGNLVYGFQRLGEACGAISRRAMAEVDGRAFWMGHRGFYAYDGVVSPVPCAVGDYVWNRLNQDQASQVAADVRSDFGEIWWYYPTGTSDCDEAVVYDYVQRLWRIETVARTAGVDRNVLEYPLAASPGGAIYEHEIPGAGYGGMTPYAESAPVEIGNGDQVMDILQLVPDADTLGGARVRIYSRMYPLAQEYDEGLYSLGNPTDMRITARQVRVRVQQASPGWRWGVPRLQVQPGSSR